MNKSANIHSPMIADEQIIELYWQRDENAIRKTETKYGKMLFGIAYNILHDRLDCEECKNDTYLGIWNTIPPKRPALFAAFISKIMRNIAIDKYKQKTSQKRIPSELTASIEDLQNVLCGDDYESEYESKELGRLISDYLRTLTDRQQYIFISRFYMAETIEQISKELDIGIATVHRNIEKIRQGLKLHLERNGVNI